jgi:hypothetical protein
VDVEQRLLNLADSFAEQTSEKDLDVFTAQVLSRLGLTVPSKAESIGGADLQRVGPSGGGLREGDDADREVGEGRHGRSSGTGEL